MYNFILSLNYYTLLLCMEKRYLKRIQTHTVDVVNQEGEVIDTQTSTIKYLAGTKEDFFLAYASWIIYLKKSADLKVGLFAALIERYADGKEFVMGRAMKDIIAEECECSSRSLDLAFTQLLKEELIISTYPRRYKVNPRYAFKGSSKNRDAAYKVVLELHYKDK